MRSHSTSLVPAALSLIAMMIAAAVTSPCLRAQEPTRGKPTRGLAELARGEEAIRAADVNVSLLIVDLDALRKRVDETLRVLRDSKKDVDRAGRRDAATQIGALEEATTKLQEQLDAHLSALQRIHGHGAAAESDPLGTLKKAIDGGLAVQDVEARARDLLKLKNEFRDSPFVTLLHFHLGEVRREQSKVEQDKGSTQQAVLLLNQAVDAYEAAIVENMEDDIRDVIGTSLRATALCRCIQVESALYLAYADKARRAGDRGARTRAKSYAESATAKFDDLKRRHAEDRLVADGQTTVVDEAYQDVRRMEDDIRRR